MEGNTRTTAVFAIKYLRSLGYHATSNMFRENSWYFRNALVRANYADYARGVKREWGYLEAFFRDLLLGEANELKSRYLRIGLDHEPPRFGSGLKSDLKSSLKSDLKILAEIGRDKRVTIPGLCEKTGLSRSGVKKVLLRLKAVGRLRRVGPDKGGHWEVAEVSHGGAER